MDSTWMSLHRPASVPAGLAPGDGAVGWIVGEREDGSPTFPAFEFDLNLVS